jgi:putative ABC transport system permease protein
VMDIVSAGVNFFPTIGARLVEGRWFSESDRPGAEKVAIVNQALARDQFPGRSAIGQTIQADGGWTIVGVVADFRQRGLEHEFNPVLYKPLAQTGPHIYQQVVVRTSPGAEMGDRVRAMIREIDVAQLPPEIVTMHDRMDDAIAPRRFTVILLGIFAGLAATLAIVGLYGLLSYLVAERTREIGIRVALGADAGRVLRYVLGSGLTLTAVGVVLGVGCSVVAVRLLESMVYDMSVYDPWMFGASAALLVVVAALASYLPARRAARVDPVSALRMD